MDEGKLPNSVLDEAILSKLNISNDDVLIKPSIGEDCSALSFGEDACVLTCDPITGSVSDVGHLAVYISCNDIASAGAVPVGLLITVLAPAGASVDQISYVMDQVNQSAGRLNVSILGGHTEITSAVNRFVVNVTAIGKGRTKDIIKTSGAKAGDTLIMTKGAALEGIGIILKDVNNNAALNEYKINNAGAVKEFTDSVIDMISVVPEGIIAAKCGVHAMHDATEGGILGAAWEMATASGLGLEIDRSEIIIDKITSDVCEICEIDPLRLISSGCMLIATDNPEKLLSCLENEGIKASAFGKFVGNSQCLINENGKTEAIDPPDVDELYKVINKHFKTF